jgi:DNA-binding transcriptional MerR regulator
VEIPDKPSFKIGEVARLLGVEAYVLRYWESEFDELTPSKTPSGQRAYVAADIELLVRIRALLYDEMYTIAGARRQLELDPTGEGAPPMTLGRAAELEAQLEGVGRERDELASELARARGELFEALESGGAASARERELERELSEMADLLQERTRAMAALEASATGGSEREGELTEALEAAGAERARAERAVEAYREQVNALEEQRASLERRLDEMSAKARQGRQGRSLLVEALRREVRGLRSIADEAV